MKHVFLLIALFVLTPQAVVNRLAAGWSEWRVLDAYYAPSVAATPEQVAAVADVLAGRVACDPGLYFMYSEADVRWLGYEHYTPVRIVRAADGRKVLFYTRWFKK